MKRIVSDATREKQKLARLRFLANGGIPGMLGKKQSKKQKEAVRKANIGNIHGVGERDQKFKDRISEIAHGRDMGLRRGMKNSFEHNRKIKESLMGWTSRVSKKRLKNWKDGIKLARSKLDLNANNRHRRKYKYLV